MNTDVLLKEKWDAQKKLAELSGYNIKIMLDNVEKLVNNLLKEHNIKLKISQRVP
jgi:hypothetical protein